MLENTEPTGNSKDSFDSEGFFEQLDREVNSSVLDDDTIEEKPTEQVTQPIEKADSDDTVNYEKRYKDSSREALQQRETLNQYEPFFPILDAMKRDPQMVGVVRDYLNGKQGPPKSVTEQLKLDEDFDFDYDEAIKNPDSDSGRVFNHMVDRVVNDRLSQAQTKAQSEFNQQAQVQQQVEEAQSFMKRSGMSEDQFRGMMAEADKRKMTLDDVYYILNRDKAAQNIDKNVRKDMRSQMSNAQQTTPSVASASNVQSGGESDNMFNSLLSLDNNLDDLFG